VLIQSQPTWRQLPQQQQRWKYSGCECCDDGIPCVVGGGKCSAVPAYYSVSISGTTNFTSSLCESCLNATHRLVNRSLVVDGTQIPEARVSCNGTLSNWQANCNSLCDTWYSTNRQGGGLCASLVVLLITAAVARVTILSGGSFGSDLSQATYQLAIASWDCLGSNTLPHVSGCVGFGCGCNNYPASLTVTPTT
jgi:hypothetical protein